MSQGPFGNGWRLQMPGWTFAPDPTPEGVHETKKSAQRRLADSTKDLPPYQFPPSPPESYGDGTQTQHPITSHGLMQQACKLISVIPGALTAQAASAASALYVNSRQKCQTSAWSMLWVEQTVLHVFCRRIRMILNHPAAKPIAQDGLKYIGTELRASAPFWNSLVPRFPPLGGPFPSASKTIHEFIPLSPELLPADAEMVHAEPHVSMEIMKVASEDCCVLLRY